MNTWRGIAVSGALVAAAPAWGHGMNKGQMVLRMSGDTVYVQATPDSAIFERFDDNRDGHLSRTEVSAHRAEMIAMFERGFQLTDPSGQAGERIFADLGVSHGHGHGHGAHVSIQLRYRWSEPPGHLGVTYTLGEQAPLKVTAQQVAASRAIPEQHPVGPVLTATFSQPHTSTTIFGAPHVSQ